MIINGTEKTFSQLTVQTLIKELGLATDRIVVEVEGDIIAPGEFGTRWLSGDEVVEIVSFVGGG